MRCLFKSNNLIGDALNISPAWRQWISKFYQSGDDIIMQTLPDHVAPLYQGMVRDLVSIKTVFERPEGEFSFEHVFDVSKAFQISDQNKCHVAESYAELLGVKLEGGNERLKPTYIIDEGEAYGAGPNPQSNTIDNLNQCILISGFSASCTSRDKNNPNLPPNKMVPWPKWKPMINFLRESFPDTPIRFLGAPTDFIPNGYAKDIVKPGEYMLGIPLNRLALIMKYAKLLVTIDNGCSHLGASQEVPTFLMYPRCLGLHFILPIGNPNLVYVHMDPAYVNPAQLLHGLKFACNKFGLTNKENV